MKVRRKSQVSDSESSEASPSLRGNLNTSSVNINNVSDSDTSGNSAPPEPSPKKGSRSPKKTVTFSPFDKFVSENEGLTRVIINDLISEDDDICLLEVPATIDPDELIEKRIKFHKRTKIKLSDAKYVVTPCDEENRPITLLMDQLKIVHPITILRVHQYLKSSTYECEPPANMETCVPQLPKNLKVRHPLFGSDYKSKIILDEDVQKRLDEIINKAARKIEKKKQLEEQHNLESSSSVKKKKKKKKRDEQLDENNVDESIFALLETHIAANKSKNSMRDEEANLESNLEDSVKEHKNKKKKKNKHKVNEVEEPSDGFKEEESFFEGKKKSPKKRHDKKQDESFTSPHDFEDHSQRKRKSSIHLGNKIEKKQHESFASPSDYEDHSERKRKNSVKQEKRKSMNGDFENRARDNSIRKEDNESVLQQVKEEKRKRKNSMRSEESFGEDTEKKSKRHSVANSTIIPGLQLPLFEFDVSGIMMNKEDNRKEPEVENKLHKVKKEKNQSFKNEEIDNGDETSYDSNTKKLQKKYELDDENNRSSPKKKRKKIKEEPVEESEDDETKNSLIQELLSKVKIELGSSVNVKKKKTKYEVLN